MTELLFYLGIFAALCLITAMFIRIDRDTEELEDNENEDLRGRAYQPR